jgi:hypothetical protein
MLETSTLAAAATSGCAARLYQHMLGLLLCPAKSTLSNLICARGGQHADWSADYRLYSRERVDESFLFGHARDTLIEHLAPDQPLVIGLDDTIVRKTGKKIHGSYTNKTVLRGKPDGSTHIGRGRKDMVLHYEPETVAGVNGRPRRYGIQAPTPAQMAQGSQP